MPFMMQACDFYRSYTFELIKAVPNTVFDIIESSDWWKETSFSIYHVQYKVVANKVVAKTRDWSIKSIFDQNSNKT